MITFGMIAENTKNLDSMRDHAGEPEIRAAIETIVQAENVTLTGDLIEDWRKAVEWRSYKDWPKRGPTDDDSYYLGCVNSHRQATAEEMAGEVLALVQDQQNHAE